MGAAPVAPAHCADSLFSYTQHPSSTVEVHPARRAAASPCGGSTPARTPGHCSKPFPPTTRTPTTPTPPGAIPVNPSFLALNPDSTRLYAVHGDATTVSAFAVDPARGPLTLLNTIDVGRRNPVHLTLDPTGNWLIVTFLAVPGSVVTLPVRGDGSLGAAAGVLELPAWQGLRTAPGHFRDTGRHRRKRDTYQA
ncbi:beta-propeller fold lactonase family protein [Streptomyces sp. NPDC048484]|uniref:lactonase family protein n=1 Tax=Streptomyces sp. NPDC048484 TaxID=3155146 RepID=UPI00341FC5DE